MVVVVVPKTGFAEFDGGCLQNRILLSAGQNPFRSILGNLVVCLVRLVVPSVCQKNAAQEEADGQGQSQSHASAARRGIRVGVGHLHRRCAARGLAFSQTRRGDSLPARCLLQKPRQFLRRPIFQGGHAKKVANRPANSVEGSKAAGESKRRETKPGSFCARRGGRHHGAPPSVHWVDKGRFRQIHFASPPAPASAFSFPQKTAKTAETLKNRTKRAPEVMRMSQK